MNINPVNIARAFEYNRNSFVSSNNEGKKSFSKLSVDLTEKFEPGEKKSDMLNTAGKIQPQYNPSAPVVKSNIASKEIFEVIHYEDVLEKSISKSQSAGNLILESAAAELAAESNFETGKGFYLTIAKSDLEKMSSYTKEKQINLEKYNPGKKAKTGVLVDLFV